MPVVDNVIGIIRGINDRKRNAKVEDVLAGSGDPSKNFLNAPQEALTRLMEVDPRAAIQNSQAYEAQQAQRNKSAAELTGSRTEQVAKYLRGLDPQTADYGQAIDGLSPFLQSSLGMTPDEIANFRGAFVENPMMLQGTDDDAFSAIAKDRYGESIATPGSYVRRGGKTVERVPFARKVENTPSGAIGRVFDPNSGEFLGGDGGDQPAPAQAAPTGAAPPVGELSVETLLPHFVGQESGDDYTAVNKESGAMGRYQIMPETGQATARQLGLAWRPDMMTQDNPSARRYQDAIGQARIQEAIEFGGGDLDRTTAHYFAGPDERKWGPKTRQYQQDMRNRLSGGGGAIAQREPPQLGRFSTINPKPPSSSTAANKDYRIATPAEVKALGFEDGTVVQLDQDNKANVLQRPSASDKKLNAKTVESGRQMVDSFISLKQKAQLLLDNTKGLNSATGSIQGRLPDAFFAFDQNATNFINNLENLKQNVGLTALQQFKAMSSAGASGFGNLSNAEGERLEALFGSLARSSDEEAMRRTLRNIIAIADDKINSGNATLKEYDAGSQSGSQSANPIAVNKKTGARMRWNGKKWEPIR